MLAYSSSTTAATISRPRAKPALAHDAARRRSSPRRRPSCPATPRPYSRPSRTTGANGALMPSTPTVSMWPQNISDGPGAPLEHADDVRPSRRDLLQVHLETERAQMIGDRSRDAPLRRLRR